MTTCAKLTPKLAPKNPEADVSALKGEIDRLVYRLYDISGSDGSANRPCLSEVTFAVAGNNEVVKGFSRFLTVDAVSSPRSECTEKRGKDTASTLGRVQINKMQDFEKDGGFAGPLFCHVKNLVPYFIS